MIQMIEKKRQLLLEECEERIRIQKELYSIAMRRTEDLCSKCDKECSTACSSLIDYINGD